MREEGYSAELVNEEIRDSTVKIDYPRVEGLPNTAAQRRINEQIKSLVDDLTTNPDNLHPAYEPDSTEITLTYQVGVNLNGVLSLYFEVYSFPEQAANGRTVASSLNFSLDTGHNYQLSEQFEPGSDYLDRINVIIKEEFKKKDWPQINEFESISPEQGYYLTENTLNIYFQEVEYTPHYVGIPVFEIPYLAVSDMADPRGLIAPIIEKSDFPLSRTVINIRYR
ncbi:MAG: DUF3298 domain-containing protein [Firmicutes bacterium]|nr:DUF3298 domain-containing protein [Bacillota bacterium]